LPGVSNRLPDRVQAVWGGLGSAEPDRVDSAATTVARPGTAQGQLEVTSTDSALRKYLKFTVKAGRRKALAPDWAVQGIHQTVVGERWVEFAVGFMLAMEDGWVG